MVQSKIYYLFTSHTLADNLSVLVYEHIWLGSGEQAFNAFAEHFISGIYF